jgi:hypothetical protein
MEVAVSRRRLVLIAVAVLLAVALLAPLWLGYFGPRTAAYAQTWRPWRTHLTMQYARATPGRPSPYTMQANYRDPWPGEARNPGWQVEFLTVERAASWLPWIVTERGSGP